MKAIVLINLEKLLMVRANNRAEFLGINPAYSEE
jgi:hypothetical protein